MKEQTSNSANEAHSQASYAFNHSHRTVTDMAINPLGLAVAAVSVVTSGMQQILCGVVQRKHSMTSNQLLSNTAPVQVSGQMM